MPAESPALVDRLFAEVQCYLDGLDDPPVRHLRQVVITQREQRSLTPRRLPVLDWLGPAAASRHTQEALHERLLSALADAADQLAWHQSYTADEIGDCFLQRYGWSELIGPRAPIPSGAIRCGFLLLGPHITYPSHAHGPEEIYWPLTEASYWQKDTPDWVRGIPHRPIHHTAWMPHAMRTGDTPLVALYLWYNGDLSQKPSLG